jgi:hypothetical protein
MRFVWHCLGYLLEFDEPGFDLREFFAIVLKFGREFGGARCDCLGNDIIE